MAQINRSIDKSLDSKNLDSKSLDSSPMVAPAKPTVNQMRERDAELVRGRFIFLEVPGGTLQFSYRKYKGDKMKYYSIKDGEVCTIPRGVAKHLATSGAYPIHEYATDETGKPIVRIGRMKKRYNFESLEFFDENDISERRLYTVEKI